MSFAPALHKIAQFSDPGSTHIFGGKADVAWQLLKPKTAPTPPGVPNPNDAANAAQSTTDQMRLRRGMLANLYAGSTNQVPVTGKNTLGA